MVFYRVPNQGFVEALILDVNLDDCMEPYYTIRLENGWVKHTENDNIFGVPNADKTENYIINSYATLKDRPRTGRYQAATRAPFASSESPTSKTSKISYSHHSRSQKSTSPPDNHNRRSFAQCVVRRRSSVRKPKLHHSNEGTPNRHKVSITLSRKSRTAHSSPATHGISWSVNEPSLSLELDEQKRLKRESGIKPSRPGHQDDTNENKIRQKMFSVVNGRAIRRSIIAYTNSRF